MKTSRNSKHISVKRLREMLNDHPQISREEFIVVTKFISYVELNRNK